MSWSLIIYQYPGGPILLDASDYLRACEFSNDEHGHFRLTARARLPQSGLFAVYDQLNAHVELTYNAAPVWIGRLEEPGVETGQGDELGINAVGYASAFTDAPFTASYTATSPRTIAAAVVAAVNAVNSRISSATALIMDPGTTITENWQDTRCNTVLDRLTVLGDSQTPPRLWQWTVWNRTLAFQPRGFGGREWAVDAEDLVLRRSLSTLANSAYGVYRDGANQRVVTATATNNASANRFRLTRQFPVQVDTIDSALAARVRDVFIEQHRLPLGSAEFAFRRLQDKHGANWDLWWARSGDTIEARNLAPTLSSDIDRIRKFRVKGMRYNIFTRQIGVTPELPLSQVGW